MDEFSLIERYFRLPTSHTRLGVGDDAAIIAVTPDSELAVSVDTLVNTVHFPSRLPAADIAHRALASNLSDMAAMGAKPRWVTLALTLPEPDTTWLGEFAAAFSTLAADYRVDLIGGDTTRGPLTISVQIMGELPVGQALRRSGGQAGDDIYVSGTLGDAAAGLQCWDHKNDTSGDDDLSYLQQRFCRPEPRIELGQRLLGFAHCAIDVSDGLLQDLGHLLAASQCGGWIECTNLPLSDALLSRFGHDTAIEFALTGGDDYELLFCAPATFSDALASMPVTRIGQLTTSREFRVLRNGEPIETDGLSGYRHFRSD